MRVASRCVPCMVESRGLLLCRDLVSVDGSLHSRKHDIGNTTLSLVSMRAKYVEAVGLVRILARLSLLEMKRTTKVLEATLSRTK